MAFDAMEAEHEALVHRFAEVLDGFPLTGGNMFVIVTALADVVANVMLRCEAMDLDRPWALFLDHLMDSGKRQRQATGQPKPRRAGRHG